MTHPSVHRKPAGFTLVEVLISASLLGVILAIAMQVFMDARRVSSKAQARITAQTEAAQGLKGVVALLRRAHIIFFTGRPLQDFRPTSVFQLRMGVDPGGPPTRRDPDTFPIPASLANPAGGVPYRFAGGSELNITALPNTYSPMADNKLRSLFRFVDEKGSPGFLTSAQRLMSADLNISATDPAQAHDKYFSSPLAYFAEARFDKTPADPADPLAGSVQSGDLPLYWNFHVLYLAPMDMNAERQAGWLAYRNQTHDQVRTTGPIVWPRSTIPFELRLFSIEGVDADRNDVLEHDTGPGGRIRAPWPLDQTVILSAPFDYSRPGHMANYDPLPVPMEPNGALKLDPSPGFYWRSNVSPYPLEGPRDGGGERVRGGGLHTNYSNLGNEPPTQQALSQTHNGFGQTWPRARDRVLARYIDPDAVNGTFVRLENSLRFDATDHNPARPYRRYLNAYNDGFLYNRYAALLAPSPPDSQLREQLAVPRRALVSVTTRYRSDKRQPFAFSTQTQEIDLEGVTAFQSIDRFNRK